MSGVYNRLENLCDTCVFEIATCPTNAYSVEYGDSSTGDNIIRCPNYDRDLQRSQPVNAAAGGNELPGTN